MKIAALADIHANIRAFEAVADDIAQWRPDVVVVAGDIVNRGPMPAECLSFAKRMERERGWLLVRGNHEDYVIEHSLPQTPRSGPRFEVIQSSHWTYEKLNRDVSALKELPFSVEFASRADKGARDDVRVTHASMRGIRDGIFTFTPDHVLAEQLGAPAPRLLVVGHTHVPLIRALNGSRVVNVGAVGLPFDRDPRAAYARAELRHGEWAIEIVRVSYDRDRAERDYTESGFLDEGGPLAALILEEHRRATSCLFQWVQLYLDDVMHERITVAAAAAQFLERIRHDRTILRYSMPT